MPARRGSYRVIPPTPRCLGRLTEVAGGDPDGVSLETPRNLGFTGSGGQDPTRRVLCSASALLDVAGMMPEPSAETADGALPRGRRGKAGGRSGLHCGIRSLGSVVKVSSRAFRRCFELGHVGCRLCSGLRAWLLADFQGMGSRPWGRGRPAVE